VTGQEFQDLVWVRRNAKWLAPLLRYLIVVVMTVITTSGVWYVAVRGLFVDVTNAKQALIESCADRKALWQEVAAHKEENAKATLVTMQRLEALQNDMDWLVGRKAKLASSSTNKP
jgi:hypothetical protein